MKSPRNLCGLLKKLDRLIVLNIPNILGAKPKPFKFANFLVAKPEFLPIMKQVWCKNIQGDQNTKYFHRAIKEKRNSSRIEFIEDLEGNFYSGDGVGEQFVKYFEGVLGRSEKVEPISDPS
ncbi:hypothetical protein Tco_1369021 [Tanacetum coccineum]